MFKALTAVSILSVFASLANANEVITNGGFETGNFAGWTVSNTAGGTGSFFVASAPVTPLTGNPTVGPKSGSFYAVSDQFAPGSHAITQSFTALASTDYVLSFDMFVNDWVGGQFGGEADLLAAGSDPILGPALHVFYHADTAVTGGAPNPYVHTSLDITGDLVAGVTYQLRFFESDATGPLNVGVDNVSLIATTTGAVPEPKLLLFPLALLMGIVVYRWRRNSEVID